jgi:hypothetical protein
VRKLTAITFLLFLFGSTPLLAQVVTDGLIISDTITREEIDPLRPSKAAFYSAVLPGLGQAYNKKYWKIPLVYGAIGATLYVYSYNNTRYHDFRDEYKRRLAGEPGLEEFEFLDRDRLIRAQRFHQRNRDLSLLVAAAFYVLNIVDANIDAHLQQFNVDENLSLSPKVYQNQIDYKTNVGVSLNYTFR